MIQSMTGFGRGEAGNSNYKIEIEVKSVNHRYLDMNIRLPKKLNSFEAMIRNLMKEYVSRGKVDVFVNYSNLSGKDTTLHYNPEIARAYYDGLKQLSYDLQIEDTSVAYEISRFPDVFTQEEQAVDEHEIESLLEQAIGQAGEMFIKSRQLEGEKLKEDLTDKLKKVEQLVDAISERAPEIVAEYRQRITEKVNELLGDTHVDENVLATEIVVYADKICVDEEMVRLKTHVAHMLETLSESGAIGRKLDFLTQEMNREANTTLSKSNDVQVANYGIELKTEIEKIREQIQNIE